MLRERMLLRSLNDHLLKMNNALLDRAAELNRAGTAFALATVVRAEKPTSAKPGASAIITGDGTLTGWVGGSCPV